LLGVGGSNLAAAEQADLFAETANDSAAPVDKTVDEIRERFGDASVGRASTLGRQDRRQ
jgi:hypothetical protein